MGIFIANENGDWWQWEERRSMYILDTDDVPFAVLDKLGLIDPETNQAYEDWYPDESMIWEYGKQVEQDRLLD